MAEHTLTVRKLVVLADRVLLFGDVLTYPVIASPSAQYTITIGDVITYDPIGRDFGAYLAVAPAVRPEQP